MDVAIINNNVSIPGSALVKNNENSIDTASINIERNNSIKFDYSKVLMDLEEIQDFLFMLIGSENPAKAGKSDKGVNIDLLA
jgi:hypothetical protein